MFEQIKEKAVIAIKAVAVIYLISALDTLGFHRLASDLKLAVVCIVGTAVVMRARGHRVAAPQRVEEPYPQAVERSAWRPEGGQRAGMPASVSPAMPVAAAAPTAVMEPVPAAEPVRAPVAPVAAPAEPVAAAVPVPVEAPEDPAEPVPVPAPEPMVAASDPQEIPTELLGTVAEAADEPTADEYEDVAATLAAHDEGMPAFPFDVEGAPPVDERHTEPESASEGELRVRVTTRGWDELGEIQVETQESVATGTLETALAGALDQQRAGVPTRNLYQQIVTHPLADTVPAIYECWLSEVRQIEIVVEHADPQQRAGADEPAHTWLEDPPSDEEEHEQHAPASLAGDLAAV
jgi:hypothetical protein